MSAYLVKPEHIGELIKWIKSPGKHMNGYNIYTKEATSENNFANDTY